VLPSWTVELDGWNVMFVDAAPTPCVNLDWAMVVANGGPLVYQLGG
jgi:hypothetical protein